jgi:hypothetical protein
MCHDVIQGYATDLDGEPVVAILAAIGLRVRGYSTSSRLPLTIPISKKA